MDNAAGLMIMFVSVAMVLGVSLISGYVEGRKRSSVELIKGPGMKFHAAGKQVKCFHCGGESFSDRQVQLNTWFATFLNLDWLNRRATTLECTSCGQIQWFKQKPTTASEND